MELRAPTTSATGRAPNNSARLYSYSFSIFVNPFGTILRARSGLRPTRGFSLLELLVAIALIGMIAATFIVSIPGLMDGLGSRPLPEILQKSVREARYQAALRKELVTLSFDNEAGAFVVRDKSGGILASRESGYGKSYGGLQVRFFQILPVKGLSSSSRESEQVEIAAVRFHPDRSSTPFIAQLDVENLRSRHRYDPFSDLEIKDE